MVEVVVMEEGDAERWVRVGPKAVRRRRREPVVVVVVRRGVKDWKRLVRVGEGILFWVVGLWW